MTWSPLLGRAEQQLADVFQFTRAVRQSLQGITPQAIHTATASAFATARAVEHDAIYTVMLVPGVAIETYVGQRLAAPTGEHALIAALSAELAARLLNPGATVTLSAVAAAAQQAQYRPHRRLLITDQGCTAHRICLRTPSDLTLTRLIHDVDELNPVLQLARVPDSVQLYIPYRQAPAAAERVARLTARGRLPINVVPWHLRVWP